VMKISTGALEFPYDRVAGASKALSHIDLVLSQFPIECITWFADECYMQEIQFVCSVNVDGIDQSRQMISQHCI
jgi:hypothetical protein